MSTGTGSITTEDALLGGALILRQPARGYRLTSDAVLLAALTPVCPGQRILELGTGYGQVALCLLAREPSLQVTGLELMPQAAELARQNAILNGLTDRFEIVEGDVATCTLSGFDVVVSNPPYRAAAKHTPSADPVKAAATVESVPLPVWIAAAARALNPDGQLVLIQDARRLDEICMACATYGLTDVVVLPLVSMTGRAAGRVVVRARRGRQEQRCTLPGLVLHADDGGWQPEVEKALRMPYALPLWPDG